MSDYVKIDEVVARAMVQLKLSSPDDKLRLQMYIDEGARSLNNLSCYTENYETFPIVDYKVKIPCGLVKLLGARLTDSNNCCCDGTDVTYVDTIFATSCCNRCSVSTSILRNCCDYELKFKMINGYFQFHIPTDAAYLHLAWLGYNTGDDGLMRINTRFERGLANYAMAMEGYSPGSTIDRRLADQYYDIWIAQKDMLNGQDNLNQWNLEKGWIGENLLNRIKISPRF